MNASALSPILRGLLAAGFLAAAAVTAGAQEPGGPVPAETLQEAAAGLASRKKEVVQNALKKLAKPAAREFAPQVAALLENAFLDELAVATLAAMKADAYADKIAALLDRKELVLSAAVMNALVALNDGRCVDAAVAVRSLPSNYWNNERDLSGKAVDVLRSFGQKADRARIAAGLATASDDRTLMAIIEALRIIGARDQRHLVAALLTTAQTSNVRIAAIEFLVAMDAPDCAPQLAAMLQSLDLTKKEATREDREDRAVLPAAIDALGRFHFVASAADLRRVKESPNGGDLRALAAEALLKMGEATVNGTVPFLCSLLHSEASQGSDDETPHALEVLVRLGAQEALEPILHALGGTSRGKTYYSRWSVCKALRLLGFDRNPGMIARFLIPDASPGVRMGALRALEEFRAMECEGEILPLLAAGEPLAIREAAALTLTSCGTAKAGEICRNLMFSDETEVLRLAALEAVFWIKRYAAIPDIIQLLEKPGPEELRATALQELGTSDLGLPKLSLTKPYPGQPTLGLPKLEEGEKFAPVIIRCLDGAEPYRVRLAAAELLGQTDWKSAGPPLANLLRPGEPLRDTACRALKDKPGRLDEATRSKVVKSAVVLLETPPTDNTLSAYDLVVLLKTTARGEELALLFPFLARDRPPNLRYDAVELVSKWKSPQSVEAVRPLLAADESDDLQKCVIETLRIIDLPEADTALTLVLTMDETPAIVSAALKCFEESGRAARVQEVAAMLRRPEPEVKLAAIAALAAMRDPEATAAIRTLFPPENREVEEAALKALGKTGAFAESDFADAYIHHEDPELRALALTAIGKSGGGKFTGDLIKACDDPVDSVREAAVRGVGALPASVSLPLLQPLLLHKNLKVRHAAVAELHKSWPEEPAGGWSIFVEAACRHPGFRADVLAAGLSVVHTDSRKVALKFLSGPRKAPALDRTKARSIVASLQDLAADARRSSFTAARETCGGAIADVVTATEWHSSDLPYLDALADEVEGDASHLNAAEIRAVAEAIRKADPLRRNLRTVAWVLGIYILVWFLLLLLYPWSRLAQAMVWTGWVRRGLGFGWVGALVLGVPWLRRRMWQPFREALVPPGEVVSFDEWTFFDSVRVTPAGGGEMQPALRVFSGFSGVVVLSGESGLGKTTLLQALAGLSPGRPVALLRAAECGEGLVAALRRRLPGHAQGDLGFLRALVRRKSPDILVDAVHEALPEVRAKVTTEVEWLRGANILLTTQPVADWTRPQGAAEWRLEPLSARDMYPFLLKQGTAAVEAAGGAGAGSLTERQREFAVRTAAFLEYLERLPPESGEARALRRMLGNPMEAVLAAELLAAGQTPEPGRLLAQRMEHLEEDYAAQCGGEFPAAAFAEHLRSWRASGAPVLRMEREVFGRVASFLAKHRLLRKSADGAEAWRFRHDKVMEWFLRGVGA